jgi:hypothetical protein
MTLKMKHWSHGRDTLAHMPFGPLPESGFRVGIKPQQLKTLKMRATCSLPRCSSFRLQLNAFTPEAEADLKLWSSQIRRLSYRAPTYTRWSRELPLAEKMACGNTGVAKLLRIFSVARSSAVSSSKSSDNAPIALTVLS